MDENLLSYIESAKAQGFSRNDIEEQLINAGWDLQLVTQALDRLFPQVMPISDGLLRDIQIPSELTYSPPQTNADSGMDTVHTFTLSEIAEEPSVQQMPLQPQRTDPLLYMTSPTTPVIISEHHPLQSAIKYAGSGIVVLLVVVGLYYGVQLFSSERDHVQTAQQSQAQTASSNGLKMDTYTNYKYNFQMRLPADWARKEYSIKDYGGEARFAFGEAKDLPKEFFNEGNYMWLRIYNSADVAQHSEYEYFKAQFSKDSTKATLLGGESAIDTGVVVTAEHKGYVYSLYLMSVKDEEGRLIYTPLSKQVWESFKFLQ
jgi:hypothetical protein